MKAFPDRDKLTDGRGWLPLHWAVAAATGEQQHGVTEADVKAMYGLDPLALCRHHLMKSIDGFGYTPSHLLCTLETTERTKALVRFFSTARPQSFTMNVRYNRLHHVDAGDHFGALHVACRFGQPTEWLVQQLLQLDSSACIRTTRINYIERTPLGLLCEHSAHVDEGVLRCLLAADSSGKVVCHGIEGCFTSKQLTNRVALVTRLLEVNPQAAQHKDWYGRTLAHWACKYSDHMTAEERIDILKLLLALHRDAFKEADGDGCLPSHYLAHYGTVEALEYLLGACPEVPATALTTESRNLLHCVTMGRSEGLAAKAWLLCAQYPAMMLQRDSDGQTPLFKALCIQSMEVTMVVCEAGGREVASAAVVNPTYADHDYNGWLPLHDFIEFHADCLKMESQLSPRADVFHLLLRLYPEAAGVEAGFGQFKNTPYGLAVNWGLPAYYCRLLLRAAPALDPAELRRLNWAERRMAMFVAFAAAARQPPLLARLR